MNTALKSVFALFCFCSCSFQLFAGQAPLPSTTGENITRPGGVLILVAGIALLFLSPLALERIFPKKLKLS